MMSSWQHPTWHGDGCGSGWRYFLDLGSVFPDGIFSITGHQVSSMLTTWLIHTRDYKTNIYKKSPSLYFSFRLFAEVKKHLKTAMLCRMFLLHCGVACQEELWSWPCRMSQRRFDVQPVDVLPICSNWKAEIISTRLDAGGFSLHSHDGAWPSVSHSAIFPLLGLRWGSELRVTAATHLFLHASDSLHVSALCEYFLFTPLAMPWRLCVHNYTLFAAIPWTPAGGPRLRCSTKNSATGKLSAYELLWPGWAFIYLQTTVLMCWMNSFQKKTFGTGLVSDDHCQRPPVTHVVMKNQAKNIQMNRKSTCFVSMKNPLCGVAKTNIPIDEFRLVWLKRQAPLWLAPRHKPINNSRNEREWCENITSLLLSVYRVIPLLIKILCFIE